MRWRARLAGDVFDLDTLVELYSVGNTVVTRIGAGYFLESEGFDDVTDAEDMQRVAQQVLTLMNGATLLVRKSHRRVDLAGHFIADSGAQHVIATPAVVDIRSRLAGVLTRADGSTEKIGEVVATPVSDLDLALRDPDVSDALRILGAIELDWIALYKLLEIVEGSVGGESVLVARGWAPAVELKRFTTSANHPKASGDEARHSRMKGEPKHTMTIDGARSLICHIVQQWIDKQRGVT